MHLLLFTLMLLSTSKLYAQSETIDFDRSKTIRVQKPKTTRVTPSKSTLIDDTDSLAFFYRSLLPNNRQILKWVGSETPKIGAQISVSLDEKEVGTLTIIKKTKTTVMCKYKGEEILMSKLKLYKLKYLGIPSALENGQQKSVFAPDDDLNKEFLPQIALAAFATFAHNDALDLAFNTALNREQNSLDAEILLSPPAKAPVEWLNWFWIGATYSFNVQSNSRVVLGDKERSYYLITDQPELMTVSGGIRIPTTISLLSSIEVYGVYQEERHKISLESKIVETVDSIQVNFQKTFIGAAYTIRLIDNLHLQLLYNRSLAGNLEITSSENLLEQAKGTIESQEFGIRPYMYYQLWEKSPLIDIKFDVGMVQTTNQYKMKSEAATAERSTVLEHLRIRPGLRIGVHF